jgi:hypothetical protein
MNTNTDGRRFEARISDEEELTIINNVERSLETFKRDKIQQKICRSGPGRSDLAAGTTSKFLNLPKGFFLPNSRLPSP